MWKTSVDRKEILRRNKASIAGAVVIAALGGVLALAPILPSSDASAQDAAAAFLTPNTFADVAEQVSGAVVNIQVSQTNTDDGDGQHGRDNRRGPFERFFDGPQRGQRDREDRFGNDDQFGRRGDDDRGSPQRRFSRGLGSGFIIDPSGIVVTNDHVVGDADEITVTLRNGETLDAELIGRDRSTDLAVLQVSSPDPLPFVEFADVDGVRVGDWVVAVGNPFGLGHTVTVGVVSARGRDIGSGPFDDFLQIDASINRGNSGGPTFNLEGKVIGINSAIFSPTGGNVGIGFAIPASLAQDVIADLREDGQVERGFLGVNIQGVTEDIAASVDLGEARGAIVAQVLPGTPAETAGLRVGDVILAVDGNEVERMRDLPRLIASRDVGDEATLTVWRNGESIEVSAALTARQEQQVASASTPDAVPAPEDTLGVALADLDSDTRRRLRVADDTVGAVVVDVEPGSAAEERLRRGDVVTSVDGTAVTNADEAVAAIDAAREGNDAVLLSVSRGNRSRLVAIPFDAS